jgi:hypothetical protein
MPGRVLDGRGGFAQTASLFACDGREGEREGAASEF